MNGRELDAAAYAAGLRSGTLEAAKAVLRGAEMVRCEGLNGRDGRQAERPLLSLSRIPQTIQSRPSCRDPSRTFGTSAFGLVEATTWMDMRTARLQRTEPT